MCGIETGCDPASTALYGDAYVGQNLTTISHVELLLVHQFWCGVLVGTAGKEGTVRYI